MPRCVFSTYSVFIGSSDTLCLFFGLLVFCVFFGSFGTLCLFESFDALCLLLGLLTLRPQCLFLGSFGTLCLLFGSFGTLSFFGLMVICVFFGVF